MSLNSPKKSTGTPRTNRRRQTYHVSTCAVNVHVRRCQPNPNRTGIDVDHLETGM